MVGAHRTQIKSKSRAAGRSLAALRREERGNEYCTARRAVRPQLPKPETKQQKLCRRPNKNEKHTAGAGWIGKEVVALRGASRPRFWAKPVGSGPRLASLSMKSLSVQGFLQGFCFCDPVQPEGRLGWHRGCQRVGVDACIALGAGVTGRCRSRPPIAAMPAPGSVVK